MSRRAAAPAACGCRAPVRRLKAVTSTSRRETGWIRHQPRQLRRELRQAAIYAGRLRRRQRQAAARGRRLLGRVQRLRTCGRRSGPWRRRRHRPRARQPDRRRQERHPVQPQQERPRQGHLDAAVQPAVRSHVPPRRAIERRRPADDDRHQSDLADRQSRSQSARETPTRKTYHIHGTPVYTERATDGIVFVWGENERLKAYNVNFATNRITAFRAQGTLIASGNTAAPGGMPGGRLVVSSNGTIPATAVVWGVYPTEGNANSEIVHGALVAYDATTVLNGKLKQLFHRTRIPRTAWATSPSPRRRSSRTGKSTSGPSATRSSSTGLAPGLGIAKPAGVAAASPAPAAAAAVPTQPERPAVAARAASRPSSLSDLGVHDIWLFRGRVECRRADVPKVPSRGNYQFSFFRTHSDSHHASYEVHFKSNFQGEPDLKYCVAIYCQQGFDPTTTKTSVTSMRARSRSTAGAGHGGDCSARPARRKRPKSSCRAAA